MISKFRKFVTGATLLTVVAVNSNAKAVEEGMFVGIDVGMPFAVKGTKDFTIPAGTAVPNTRSSLTNPSTRAIATAIAFDSEKDGGFIGSVTLGYMMGDGVEAGLRIGYFKDKLKDKTSNSKSVIEADNIFALANGRYYLDMDSFYPFAGVGIGAARVNAQGTIYDNGATPAEVLKFDSMIGYTIAYSAQIGVAMDLSPVLVGVNYELFGVGNIKEGKDYDDMTGKFDSLDIGTTTGKVSPKEVKFGKFNQLAHIISLTARMII